MWVNAVEFKGSCPNGEGPRLMVNLDYVAALQDAVSNTYSVEGRPWDTINGSVKVTHLVLVNRRSLPWCVI
jgi:hypothetical protein